MLLLCCTIVNYVDEADELTVFKQICPADGGRDGRRER